MIKRIIVFFVFLLSFQVAAFAAPSVSAQRAALMVADTRELIYGKNENEPCGMASTTKIMTALLTLEYAAPERQITVTEQMAAVEGTSMGLLPGDKVTYHDLVYGMLLASGNDAANTAAISIGGSTEKFARLMNQRAKEIGMANTNFVTPSGLDADSHYSTAYDMALLGCEAIENPDFRAVCSSVNAKLCYGNEPYTRWLYNHNKLLKSFEGAFGIKTGFTKKSGRCLVSAAERNGVELVCVTLNAPNDWHDHKELLEYGFSLVTEKHIDIDSYSIDVYGSDKNAVTVSAEGITVPNASSAQNFETQVLIKPYAVAPVKKGQILGEVRITENQRTVKTVPLVAKEEAKAITAEVFEKPKLSTRFIVWIKNLFIKLVSSIKERSGSAVAALN